MLEPLTLEKLKEYGFNDLLIERLSDPLNYYSCQVVNDQGTFFASNIPAIIYSGQDAEDRILGRGIDTFITFEQMYDKALQMEAVPLEDDSHLHPSNRKAFRIATRKVYQYEFNKFLQQMKKWKGEEDGDRNYQSFLTVDVWREFIAFKLEQEKRNQERAAAEKAKWQVLQEPENRLAKVERIFTNAMGGFTNPSWEAMNRIQQTLDTDSFKYFQSDMDNCLEGWQYIESAGLTFDARFDLDKEAYLKAFFDPLHDHEATYDERLLIERLITNLNNAKHPYFEQYKIYLRKRLESPEQSDPIKDAQEGNNVTLSTIDEWLFEFKEEGVISESDYTILISTLLMYFERGVFPALEGKIKIGKVNKKRFGWALGQIYRSERSDNLPEEYLQFAKDRITLFENVEFDKANMTRSNLYKYFTTKTE